MYFFKSRIVGYVLPCICLLLTIFWVIILFPAISLISGESKPRGLFVDEHALPVHSQLLRERIAPNARAVRFQDNINDSKLFGSCKSKESREVCSLIDCAAVVHIVGAVDCMKWTLQAVTNDSAIENGKGHLLQLRFGSSYTGMYMESIVLALSYASMSSATAVALVDLVGTLRAALDHRTAWLAKELVLLVPVAPGAMHFDLVLRWLQTQSSHGPAEQRRKHLTVACDRSDGTGGVRMIREAVVLDLSALTDSSQQLVYERILLQAAGINGVLPNMDLLSMAKVLNPRSLQLEGSPSAKDNACAAAIVSWIRTIVSSDTTTASAATTTFAVRLCALRRFLAVQLVGRVVPRRFSINQTAAGDSRDSTGNQIHAAFTALNIDAATFLPLPYETEADARRMEQLLQRREERAGRSSLDMRSLHLQQLTALLFRTVYALNSLHGEELLLYHSFSSLIATAS